MNCIDGRWMDSGERVQVYMELLLSETLLWCLRQLILVCFKEALLVQSSRFDRIIVKMFVLIVSAKKTWWEKVLCPFVKVLLRFVKADNCFCLPK